MNSLYRSHFRNIYQLCEKRILSIQSLIDLFNNFNQSLFSDLEFNDSVNHQISRIKKEDQKDQSNLFLQWISEYFGNNEALKQFSLNLNTKIINPLKKLKNLFNAKYVDLCNIIDSTEHTFLREVQRYDSIYGTYSDFCQQMDNEKDPSKLNVMKQQYLIIENQCIVECERLATTKKTFHVFLEERMLDYERMEKEVATSISDNFNDFIESLRDISDHLISRGDHESNFIATNSSLFDPIQIKSKLLNFFGHQPIPTYYMNIINFNIFEFITPSIVFHNLLNARVVRVKTAQSPNSFTSFNPIIGDIFDVISEKDGILYVENTSTCIRGHVSSTDVQPYLFKRFIAQVASSIKHPDFKIPSDHYVCILNETNDKFLVTTYYLSRIELPKSGIIPI